MTPARKATRVFFSSSLGLIFATGLSLSSEGLDLQNFNIYWTIPLLAFSLTVAGLATKNQIGPFKQWFPNFSEADIENISQQEIDEDDKEKQMGDAWAQLEASMIQSKAPPSHVSNGIGSGLSVTQTICPYLTSQCSGSSTVAQPS